MPTINLTLPVAGTAIDAGPMATNFSALQTLLNGGLDGANFVNASLTLGSSFALNFGGDALLQRAAADVLQTPDTFLAVVPAARVHHNAAQTLTNNTAAALSMNSERYDTNVIHDNVTNNTRLTCKTAGKYSIQGCVSFTANGTGVRQLELFLNGTTIIGLVLVPGVAATVVVLNVTCDYNLAVNDYVELRAYQNSGGNLDTVVAANYSPEFSMHYIGT